MGRNALGFIVLLLLTSNSHASLQANPQTNSGSLNTCDFVTPPSVEFFPSFADSKTQALWLFDDAEYPYASLTDASHNEYDLRLMESGHLEAGVYGSALRFQPSDKFSVSYAGFQGSISNHHMRERDGVPSGLWSPTQEPHHLLRSLTCKDWTVEFYLKLNEITKTEGTLLDLGDALLPGFELKLLGSGSGFILSNYYGGHEAKIDALAPLQNWAHYAFVFAKNKITLYIDGKPYAGEITPLTQQALPADSKPKNRQHENREFTKDSSFEWKQERRFNVSLGSSRTNENQMNGSIDEVRFSSVARYTASFNNPGTFSRNYSENAPKAMQITGPPLLFNKENARATLALGSRKHLFIDMSIIENADSAIEFKVNEMKNPETLYLQTKNGKIPFDPPRGMWRESVFDHDGKIYLFIGDGYSHADGDNRLYTSLDGINFQSEDYGKGDAIILNEHPMGATVFKDPNPQAQGETQFKMTTWVANRGIYYYFSPDAIHWRRNEVAMLPLAVGGDAESMVDDQRGLYFNFMKRGGGTNTKDDAKGRAAIFFKTSNPFMAWPFKKLTNPYFESWPFPLMSDEGELGIEPRTKLSTPWFNWADGIYRPRPFKYTWAPDSYLAFPWVSTTSIQKRTEYLRSELAVSRDGEKWTTYEGKKFGWLFPPVGEINGEKVTTTLAFYGLIKKADELWLYVENNTDDAPNGKDGQKRYFRHRAPLDRLASIAAGNNKGEVLTKIFKFEGSELVFNISAPAGKLEVALTDAKGKELSGFGFKNSEAIKNVDSIRQTVKWTGSQKLSELAGQEVRLKLRMKKAKIYGFQFTN